MKSFFGKLAVTFLVMLAAFLPVNAQTTVKHVVDRGETLASIAKMYGTTEDKIIELNPDAAQFVYVGMELVVPKKENMYMHNNAVNNTAEVISHSYISQQNNDNTVAKNEEKGYTLNDFSYYGISYFSSFDAAGSGYYMLGGCAFYDSGWGFDINIGANYGLVDSDYAGVMFLIGPAYGHAFDNLLISASFDFMGQYVNEFTWGFALLPKIGIKLGKVTPWVGINAIWYEDAKEIDLGFQVGIGFNI